MIDAPKYPRVLVALLTAICYLLIAAILIFVCSVANAPAPVTRESVPDALLGAKTVCPLAPPDPPEFITVAVAFAPPDPPQLVPAVAPSAPEAVAGVASVVVAPSAPEEAVAVAPSAPEEAVAVAPTAPVPVAPAPLVAQPAPIPVAVITAHVPAAPPAPPPAALPAPAPVAQPVFVTFVYGDKHWSILRSHLEKSEDGRSFLTINPFDPSPHQAIDLSAYGLSYWPINKVMTYLQKGKPYCLPHPTISQSNFTQLIQYADFFKTPILSDGLQKMVLIPSPPVEDEYNFTHMTGVSRSQSNKKKCRRERFPELGKRQQ